MVGVQWDRLAQGRLQDGGPQHDRQIGGQHRPGPHEHVLHHDQGREEQPGGGLEPSQVAHHRRQRHPGDEQQQQATRDRGRRPHVHDPRVQLDAAAEHEVLDVTVVRVVAQGGHTVLGHPQVLETGLDAGAVTPGPVLEQGPGGSQLGSGGQEQPRRAGGLGDGPVLGILAQSPGLGGHDDPGHCHNPHDRQNDDLGDRQTPGSRHVPPGPGRQGLPDDGAQDDGEEGQGGARVGDEEDTTEPQQGHDLHQSAPVGHETEDHDRHRRTDSELPRVGAGLEQGQRVQEHAEADRQSRPSRSQPARSPHEDGYCAGNGQEAQGGDAAGPGLDDEAALGQQGHDVGRARRQDGQHEQQREPACLAHGRPGDGDRRERGAVADAEGGRQLAAHAYADQEDDGDRHLRSTPW